MSEEAQSIALPTEAPSRTPSLPPLAAIPDTKPHLVIKPKKGLVSIDFADIWRYRDLLFQLAGRDLKLRYKQTALGAIWVVLQPLMAAGIFTFVFGVLAKLPTDGKPQFLISFIGLLGWGLFSGTLNKVSGSMAGNAHLITKVYFPRLILPLSGIPSTLVDFGVALGLGLVLMLLYGLGIPLQILLLPVWIVTLIAMAMGIGLVTASLAVSYRDINYILPVFLQMLLYASPVGYDASSVLASQPELIQQLYYLNPLAGLLEAFRWSFLGGTPPHALGLTITVVSSLTLLFAGLLMFKQLEKKFADIV
jgi:lipopolysaccharide transport system permease protein